MKICRVNIAIAEPSGIISEGLKNLLLRSQSHYYISMALTLDEVEALCGRHETDIVIINPVLLINKTSGFMKLRKQYPAIRWIGLIYSHFDSATLARFDDTISVTDSNDTITDKVTQSGRKCDCHEPPHDELSERETEVLIHLVKGLANKEIAAKLNISIHTVISHRKNIIEKTGIKSLSGLTIYAISRKIIPLGEE